MRKFITSRKQGDQIKIGDAVLTILESDEKRVKLRIMAPDSVKFEIIPRYEADMSEAGTRVPPQKPDKH